MSSFELAFNDTERAAASTIRSAAGLGKLAKRLEKAAKEGNIAAIKRAQGELGNAVNALAQEVEQRRQGHGPSRTTRRSSTCGTATPTSFAAWLPSRG